MEHFPFSLKDYQSRHASELLSMLVEHKIAIDTSITGSGKTVVSLYVANYMLKHGKIHHVMLCLPPTLFDQWKKYIEKETEFSVYSFYKLPAKAPSNTLLIVDECHYFKNENQRTANFKRLAKTAAYCLYLSATPYDDERQKNNLRYLYDVSDFSNEITSKTSRMFFSYRTEMEYYLHHITEMDTDDLKLIKKAYSTMQVMFDPETGQMNGAIFQKAIGQIHAVLMPYLIDFVKVQPFQKIIIVIRESKHFDMLVQHFPNILILNGKVPMQQRSAIIAKFQQHDMEHRMIAITPEVGGVGIELDDTHGSFPRLVVMLPTTNAISFYQTCGRVQRTNTKSDSKIVVMQPPLKNTYFKRQMKRKMSMIREYNEELKELKETFNHYQVCKDRLRATKGQFCKGVAEKIRDYYCECSSFK